MKTTPRIGWHTLLWSCAAAMILPCTSPAATLVNRYSFSELEGTNVVDSVGGTNWDGVLPNGGFFDGSQLTVAAGSQQYVKLPAGILSNYTAVTIDTWATLGTLPSACFLWAFGETDTNVLSGGQPSGQNYIMLHPYDGRIAITAADPGWQGEQGCGGAGNLSGQTVHVTAVFNPPSGYAELYLNGVLVSYNNSITIDMSSVSNRLNYIAKSLYDADSYLDAALNEFRIWNGALNPLEIAGGDIAGPDAVSTDPGAVTAIYLQIPYYQLVQGGHQSSTVMADASLAPYQINITRLASYSSANTNILTVDTNGLISAIGQGSANIIAQYGGLSSTQTITVVQPASVLVHRYTFSETPGSLTAADAIGGSAWDGTLPNGGTFTGTQLELAASGSQFMQMPAGVTSNYTAVTIEAWATFPSALPNACFFWGFGDANAGGAGIRYIFMQPRDGRIGITGSDPGWSGEQGCNGAGNLSLKTNVHVTAVFNPQAGWIAIYTNGVLVGKNTGITWQMSQVSSVLNYIARSLYSGDAYHDVNMDEFRIYDGALTSQGVAISYAAGPDSIPAGVTNGPGALQSLTLQVPASIQWFQAAPLKLFANYAGLTNFDIVGNSIFPPAGLTITSSDTNVVSYGTDGRVRGNSLGTAVITASYQGITSTQAITVVRAPMPQLVNRYTFSETSGATVADSVGGSNWDGTIPNGGAFDGSQLSLLASGSQYVNLPPYILSNYNAVTIETWASFGTLPPNCFLFGFGATETNGAGYNYIFCQPRNGAIAITQSNPGWNPDQPAGGGGNWSGRTNLHVVAIFNPPAGYEALYTNGVLAAVNLAITVPMSSISNSLSYIARSLYTGDSYIDVWLDEFRIYNGALSPDEISATQVIGPNQVLTTQTSFNAVPSGGSVVFTWPAAAAGFALESASTLSPASWVPVTSAKPQLVGSQWQVTVPNSGGTMFFRLVR